MGELPTKKRGISALTNPIDCETTLIVFDKLAAAEAALRVLKTSGFDMNNLSVVAKEVYDREPPPGSYRLDSAIISWARRGVFWGWVSGLLFGSAFIFMPQNRSIMAGGPIVGWLTGAFETSLFVGAIGALGAALISRRLNEDHVFKMKLALKDRRSSIVHASETEIRNVNTTLFTGERF